MLVGEQDVFRSEICQREIRRVVAIALYDGVPRLRLKVDVLHQFVEGDSFPLVVQSAPAGYTVDIRCQPHLRESHELIPREGDRLLHMAHHIETPLIEVDAWRRPIGQCGESIGNPLVRRYPILVRAAYSFAPPWCRWYDRSRPRKDMLGIKPT